MLDAFGSKEDLESHMLQTEVFNPTRVLAEQGHNGFTFICLVSLQLTSDLFFQEETIHFGHLEFKPSSLKITPLYWRVYFPFY